MAVDPVLTKSVTAAELTTVARGGAILNLMIPLTYPGIGADTVPLPPVPPPYWSYQRDGILRATIHHESMWAAAVGIAISKIAALSWQVESSVPKRSAMMQDLLLHADGRRGGWVHFFSKLLRDYLTTDNGCFAEIVRASSSVGSKIIGLKHLDSLRIIRTGDPNIPALYRGRDGRFHELKDHQIIMLSDMPDPGFTFYGTGLCAASRAYKAIYKLNAIETYLTEKVSGLRPLAIHIVNGVLDQQLKDAVQTAEADKVSRGLVAYMGAVIIGLPQDTSPSLVTIPLAELPDRFNRKEEFDISILTYADCLGLDPQDLQPLSHGRMGTGAQSEVLNDKAKGKGLNLFRSDWIHAMNEYVFPESTTFIFIEKDLKDLTDNANLSKILADAANIRITAGITLPEQELQVMVDKDQLPKEFLEQDITGDDNVSDDEKVESEADQAKPKKVPENSAGKITPPTKTGDTAPNDNAQADNAIKEYVQRLSGEVIEMKEGDSSMQPIYHIHVPPAQPIIHVAVQPSPIEIQSMPAPVVNITTPAQPAPVVNVTTAAPEITVNVPEQAVPEIRVENIIHPEDFPAPVVTVNVPEQPAPIVNVTMPDQKRPVRVVHNRDLAGNITSSETVYEK